jgi:PAS domain S-box-containing protein
MPASLTDLFATALDPIAVLNPDGTIALANAGFTRVLGLSPDAVLGTELPDLFHPADRDRARQVFARARQVPDDERGLALQGRCLHADGGSRWIEWTLRRSPGGTIYAAGRDESIRRQIEAAMRRRERRNRALIDATSDLLVIVDDGLRITDTNRAAAELFGATRHTLQGLHLGEVASGLVRPALPELKDGDGLTFETVLTTPDGTRIDVEVRAEGFAFEGEAMVALLARDIRAHVAQERRLRELADALERARSDAQAANDAKTGFVIQLSHALRTPLGAILGYSEMLTEGGADASDWTRDVRHIHQAASELLDRVDDVLDLARIEAGRLHLSNDYIELDDLMDDLQELLEPLLGGAILNVSLTCDPPRLVADRSRLLQLLTNLMSWCLRRNPLHVRLAIADQDDEHLVFTVSDDAPPPEPAVLEQLFEPFGPDSPGGTGLALPIARQLALAMSGTLDLTADDGVAFSVVLPSAAAPS